MNIYYNRTLTGDFAKLLENGRELRWLFDFVVKHPELDFQIGKSSSKQWISVYYGLTRLISIRKLKDSAIFIDTVATYQELSGNIQQRYKHLQIEISKQDPQRYGKDLQKKPVGNELDFLANTRSRGAFTSLVISISCLPGIASIFVGLCVFII